MYRTTVFPVLLSLKMKEEYRLGVFDFQVTVHRDKFL